MDPYAKFCFGWLCLAYCLPQRSDVSAFAATRKGVGL